MWRANWPSWFMYYHAHTHRNKNITNLLMPVMMIQKHGCQRLATNVKHISLINCNRLPIRLTIFLIEFYIWLLLLFPTMFLICIWCWMSNVQRPWSMIYVRGSPSNNHKSCWLTFISCHFGLLVGSGLRLPALSHTHLSVYDFKSTSVVSFNSNSELRLNFITSNWTEKKPSMTTGCWLQAAIGWLILWSFLMSARTKWFSF